MVVALTFDNVHLPRRVRRDGAIRILHVFVDIAAHVRHAFDERQVKPHALALRVEFLKCCLDTKFTYAHVKFMYAHVKFIYAYVCHALLVEWPVKPRALILQ